MKTNFLWKLFEEIFSDFNNIEPFDTNETYFTKPIS